MKGDASEINREIFGKLLRFSILIPSKPNKISLVWLKLPPLPIPLQKCWALPWRS